MAFDFPASPAVGQIFQPVGGPAWQWNGTAWLLVTTQVPTAQRENRLVNGAVQHAQANGFGTVLSVNTAYLADQWFANFSGPTGTTHITYLASGVSQGSGVGLVGSLGINGTATVYTSVAAGNFACLTQRLEGLVAVAPFAWGQASSVPAVLSFEAWSTVAGTFAAAIRSSNGDRSIVFPVTFAAGEINAWKTFSFVVPAITSGTFPRTTAVGADVFFTVMCGTTFQAPSSGSWLSGNYFGLAGQANLLATANQQFYVRKMGLYVDAAGTGLAPPFVIPDHILELERCKRYYQYYQQITATIWAPAAQVVYASFPLSPPMRTAPTVQFANAVFINGSALAGVMSASVGKYQWNAAAAGYSLVNFDAFIDARL